MDIQLTQNHLFFFFSFIEETSLSSLLHSVSFVMGDVTLTR
jgi:hypothetical protein